MTDRHVMSCNGAHNYLPSKKKNYRVSGMKNQTIQKVLKKKFNDTIFNVNKNFKQVKQKMSTRMNHILNNKIRTLDFFTCERKCSESTNFTQGYSSLYDRD